MSSELQQLEPSFVQRPWGRRELTPYFPDQEAKIGEVWFHAGEDHPLLIKFLFTDEKLSVQVHPPDDYAVTHGQGRGKTEMWHILAAEPGGQIALGFRDTITPEQLRHSVTDGSVEKILNWLNVEPGETYFTPAGVVHAIGAGITLCEIQQHSDATYRLYDYNRGRPLHLEKAMDVARLGPYDGRRDLPIECEHFYTEMLNIVQTAEINSRRESFVILLQGHGRIADEPLSAGQVWKVPPGRMTVEAITPLQLLRTELRP